MRRGQIRQIDRQQYVIDNVRSDNMFWTEWNDWHRLFFIVNWIRRFWPCASDMASDNRILLCISLIRWYEIEISSDFLTNFDRLVCAANWSQCASNLFRRRLWPVDTNIRSVCARYWCRIAIASERHERARKYKHAFSSPHTHTHTWCAHFYALFRYAKYRNRMPYQIRQIATITSVFAICILHTAGSPKINSTVTTFVAFSSWYIEKMVVDMLVRLNSNVDFKNSSSVQTLFNCWWIAVNRFV